jgi:hypothetical protein
MNVNHGSKAWKMLQELYDLGPQWRDHLTCFRQDEEADTAIGRLMMAGYLKRGEDNLIALTFAGKRLLSQLNQAADPDRREAGLRVIGPGTVTEPYSAKELGRTSLRPGAYDAYELPSLMAGKRVAPREIKA